MAYLQSLPIQMGSNDNNNNSNDAIHENNSQKNPKKLLDVPNNDSNENNSQISSLVAESNPPKAPPDDGVQEGDNLESPVSLLDVPNNDSNENNSQISCLVAESNPPKAPPDDGVQEGDSLESPVSLLVNMIASEELKVDLQISYYEQKSEVLKNVIQKSQKRIKKLRDETEKQKNYLEHLVYAVERMKSHKRSHMKSYWLLNSYQLSCERNLKREEEKNEKISLRLQGYLNKYEEAYEKYLKTYQELPFYKEFAKRKEVLQQLEEKEELNRKMQIQQQKMLKERDTKTLNEIIITIAAAKSNTNRYLKEAAELSKQLEEIQIQKENENLTAHNKNLEETFDVEATAAQCDLQNDLRESLVAEPMTKTTLGMQLPNELQRQNLHASPCFNFEGPRFGFSAYSKCLMPKSTSDRPTPPTVFGASLPAIHCFGDLASREKLCGIDSPQTSSSAFTGQAEFTLSFQALTLESFTISATTPKKRKTLLAPPRLKVATTTTENQQASKSLQEQPSGCSLATSGSISKSAFAALAESAKTPDGQDFAVTPDNAKTTSKSLLPQFECWRTSSVVASHPNESLSSSQDAAATSEGEPVTAATTVEQFSLPPKTAEFSFSEFQRPKQASSSSASSHSPLSTLDSTFSTGVPVATIPLPASTKPTPPQSITSAQQPRLAMTPMSTSSRGTSQTAAAVEVSVTTSTIFVAKPDAVFSTPETVPPICTNLAQTIPTPDSVKSTTALPIPTTEKQLSATANSNRSALQDSPPAKRMATERAVPPSTPKPPLERSFLESLGVTSDRLIHSSNNTTRFFEPKTPIGWNNMNSASSSAWRQKTGFNLGLGSVEEPLFAMSSEPSATASAPASPFFKPDSVRSPDPSMQGSSFLCLQANRKTSDLLGSGATFSFSSSQKEPARSKYFDDANPSNQSSDNFLKALAGSRPTGSNTPPFLFQF